MRRVNQHPLWCARGKVCAAHRRDGEHRSAPVRIEIAGCRLMATRIQTPGGRTRVELAAVVDLADDGAQATMTAVRDALDDATWDGRP